MTTMAIDNKDKKVLNVPPLRFPEFTEEWNSKSLSDLANVIGGGTPDTAVKSYWDGEIQWFTPSEIGKSKYVDLSIRTITEEGLNNSSAKLLPSGTILLSTRATIGECSLSLRKCATNQGFQSLVSKKCNTDFLYYLIQTKKKDLIRKSCGSTFLEISANEVRKIQVSVPTEVEQQRIAELLSLIDERIATQNKIIEDLKLLKSAIAETVFNNIKGHLTILSAICNIVKGKQVNGEELSEKGKYYVMNGGITPSGYYDQCNTPPNTISISEGGNSCGYVKYNKSSFWSGGHCYTLQDITSGVDTQYLFHYLKRYESNIMNLRIGTGLPNIQKKDLENFRIALPPSNVQKEISTCLTAIEDKIMVEVKWLDSAQKEKQHLLRQMFI